MLRFLAMFALAAPVSAQSPPRFEFHTGDAFKYRVQHDTTITETTPDKAATVIRTKLTLAKTWTVTRVEDDGSAMLAMAITSFRQEITRPVPGNDGKLVDETSIIDSSTPEGARATVDYLNRTILTAKVDGRGRVSDVKGTAADAASRLAAELPFRIEFPEAASEKWERAFAIKLDPPAGTGEQFQATQSCSLEKAEESRTIFRASTSLKSPPKELAELQPLLPWLWEGTVEYDPKAKRYLGARLSIQREFPNYQGVGSKFSFQSSFTETRDER